MRIKTAKRRVTAILIIFREIDVARKHGTIIMQTGNRIIPVGLLISPLPPSIVESVTCIRRWHVGTRLIISSVLLVNSLKRYSGPPLKAASAAAALSVTGYLLAPSSC